MDCERADRLIRREIDGELDPELAAELSEHLKACAACAARARTGRRISEAIRAAAPAPGALAPALDPEEILRRSRRSSQEEASLVRILRRVAAAAALITLVSGIGIVWSTAGEVRKVEAKASIREIAASSAEAHMGALIDSDNTIVIIMSRR